MRPEQVNLNTSLGPLMSEQDLAEALRQGKVKVLNTVIGNVQVFLQGHQLNRVN